MKPVYWVIAGLVLIIIALIVLDKDPEPNQENIKARELGIAISDQTIKRLRQDSTKQAKKIIRDSVRQTNERAAYQRTIKKHVAVIENLKENPIVIKVREDVAEVDSLLDAMELKDSIQTARIDTLENNLKELRVDMAGVKFNCEEMLQGEREKYQNQEALTKEYKSQVRKERRKVKLFKIVAVIGTAGAFILGGL